MITVSQYAKERGITIQAVHQSMQGKRKKERLKGHVTVIDGVKQLDDEAVRILDEARNKSPIVYEKTDRDQIIKDMEENEKNYLRKIAAQADEIAAMAKKESQNAQLIAGATHTQLLLDSTKAELAQEREGREQDKILIADLQRQLAESQAKVNSLLNRNTWERLTRKGE